jgi:hypothetical protein
MAQDSAKDEIVVAGFTHGIGTSLEGHGVKRDFSNLEKIFSVVRSETKPGDIIAVEMTEGGLEANRICGKILREGIPKGFSLPKGMPPRYARNIESFIEQYKKWGRKSLPKVLDGGDLFSISLVRFLDLRGHKIIPIDRQSRKKAYRPIMLDAEPLRRRLLEEKNEKRKQGLVKGYEAVIGRAMYPSAYLGNKSMVGKIVRLKEKGVFPKAVLVGGGHAFGIAEGLAANGLNARVRFRDQADWREAKEISEDVDRMVEQFAIGRRHEKEQRAIERRKAGARTAVKAQAATANQAKPAVQNGLPAVSAKGVWKRFFTGRRR